MRPPAKQKAAITITTKESWTWWHTLVIPATEGSTNRMIVVQKVKPYLKNNQSKKGWKHSLSSGVPA
jgi:hypothetical protein